MKTADRSDLNDVAALTCMAAGAGGLCQGSGAGLAGPDPEHLRRYVAHTSQDLTGFTVTAPKQAVESRCRLTEEQAGESSGDRADSCPESRQTA